MRKRLLIAFALAWLASGSARAGDEPPLEDTPFLRPFTRHFTPEQKKALREAYASSPEVEAFVRGRPISKPPSVEAVSATPSVLRGAGAILIRVQAANYKELTVRILNAAGKAVHESSKFDDAGVLDLETGSGRLPTVSHSWSAPGAAPGGYTFVVVARNAGKEARAYGSFRIAR